MQPKRRASTPETHLGKVVASFALGEAPRADAPLPLPSVLEGRVQSAGTSGPFVEWSGAPGPTLARVLWMEHTPDWSRCAGLKVALAFEAGDPGRPILVGLLEAPPPEAFEPPAAEPAEFWSPEEAPSPEKPEVLRIESGKELHLECGKAHIHLRADGRIEIRGEYLLSRATGPNKIKGGSVQIN